MDAGEGGGDTNGLCFPYDVLLHILRYLPVRPLAGSRRVCRAWRAIVDVHDLLRPYYFPCDAFPGIFVTKVGCDSCSAFFAPLVERGQRRVDGPDFRRPVFNHGWAEVHHSCNGLLLLKAKWSHHYYVCNPATVRCGAHLPRPSQRCASSMFLAFDPAVSPHYEVFFFQDELLPPFVPPTTFVDLKQFVPKGPAWVDLHQPYLFRLFGEEEHLPEEEKEQDGSMDMKQECLPKFFEEEEGNETETQTKEIETDTSSGLFGEETKINEDQFGSSGVADELEDISLEPLSTPDMVVEVPPIKQLQVEGLEEPKEKMVPFTVYSSLTGQWEDREFTPGRCAPVLNT